jgi:hypothetical protein
MLHRSNAKLEAFKDTAANCPPLYEPGAGRAYISGFVNNSAALGGGIFLDDSAVRLSSAPVSLVGHRKRGHTPAHSRL